PKPTTNAAAEAGGIRASHHERSPGQRPDKGTAPEPGTGGSHAAAAGKGTESRLETAHSKRTAYVGVPRASFGAGGRLRGSAHHGGTAAHLAALNSRLNAFLPAGTPVAYSDRQYTNDLTQALTEARAAYYQVAAPPQSVLERALYVVRQGAGLADGHGSIVYILKKQRFFGIEICTGWKVENDGSGAIGGYTFGSCGGDRTEPPGGLPTLAPKPAGV
ncbi:MAG: hypothetical protein M3R44_06930, partial [Candidatus Eremiobacteraeota bacterium]|nr:hypothetical protein [Candidatus Eremiobacteraeota bacterium]